MLKSIKYLNKCLPHAIQHMYVQVLGHVSRIIIVHCFCFVVKKLCCFRRSLGHLESFSINQLVLIKCAYVTGNRESFLGNEGKLSNH